MNMNMETNINIDINVELIKKQIAIPKNTLEQQQKDKNIILLFRRLVWFPQLKICRCALIHDRL